LRAERDFLNTSCRELALDYGELASSFDELNSSYALLLDEKKDAERQIAGIRSAIYAFALAITALVIVTCFLMAERGKAGS
jgi:hypothetical protein